MMGQSREAHIREFIKDGTGFIVEPFFPFIRQSPFATLFLLLLVIECPGCKVDLRSDIVNETSECLSPLLVFLYQHVAQAFMSRTEETLDEVKGTLLDGVLLWVRGML
jgi:hypothetical protein